MQSSRTLSAASLFCILFPCWASAQFGFGGGGANLFSFNPTARRNTSPYKGYSGYVLNKDNVRVVYYFDQTIVIVEVAGPKKELRNCEVIEAYNENDTLDAMETVRREVGEPFLIDMDKMVKLMKQCQLLAPIPKKQFQVKPPKITERVKNNVDTQPTSAYPILNGIIPGTKWCGTGDIADTYFDMGTEVKLD
ncbi:hypothetical protein WDU94_005748, partial [Cyamophila willieti]